MLTRAHHGSSRPRPTWPADAAADAADVRLANTVAYLRFPLRAEHGGGLPDASRCPRCGGRRVQKWGRFAGRQRFRCRDCRRTYSTFTGTPLRYLKRADRWRAFLWCMEGRLTVRRAASVLDVHRNTALRWRHRLLDHWRLEPHRRLRGRIEVGELWLPLNEKGSRCLLRLPRRHGYEPGRTGEEVQRVRLVVAMQTVTLPAPIGNRDPHTPAARDAAAAAMHANAPLATDPGIDRILELSIQRCGMSHPGRFDYLALLGSRVVEVDEIVATRGPLLPLVGFARSLGVAHRRQRHDYWNGGMYRIQRELRRWLRPLRGVATQRLDNYLEWFRRDRLAPAL